MGAHATQTEMDQIGLGSGSKSNRSLVCQKCLEIACGMVKIVVHRNRDGHHKYTASLGPIKRPETRLRGETRE